MLHADMLIEVAKLKSFTHLILCTIFQVLSRIGIMYHSFIDFRVALRNKTERQSNGTSQSAPHYNDTEAPIETVTSFHQNWTQHQHCQRSDNGKIGENVQNVARYCLSKAQSEWQPILIKVFLCCAPFTSSKRLPRYVLSLN